MTLSTKRGVLFSYLLIFTILTVAMSIGIFFHLNDQTYSFNVGEVQNGIINSYVSVNSEKFYLENNLENIFTLSVANVLDNFGMAVPVYSGDYVLWKKGDKECFPDEWNEIKESIIYNLGENIGDYDFEVFRDSGKTFLKVDSEVKYFGESSEFKVNYSEEISKEVEVGFVFDEFLSEAEYIKGISDECDFDENCWRTKLGNGYSLVVEDKLFKLEFTTPGLEGEVNVKIAVDFDPDYNFGQEELEC